MQFIEMDLFDADEFWELCVRFTLNMIVIVSLVRYLYYSTTQRKDYLFTYLLISTVVFLLCFLLENVKLELGFAMGLFAIFGIIRYRTQQIPIREMTYLFLVIGISVINALSGNKVSISEILFTNVALFTITYVLEKVYFLRHESVKAILYERIELIKPDRYEDMKKDLEERTGLTINRVEIGKIDFLRDAARVNIYYYEDHNAINSADDDSQSGESGEA